MVQKQIAFVDKKTITLNRLATSLLRDDFTVTLSGLEICYEKFAMTCGKYDLYFHGSIYDNDTIRITNDTLIEICQEYDRFVIQMNSRYLKIRKGERREDE